jgi:anti-sigma factor RsiW
MKHDFEIEIQALIDGELSPRQAHRVEARLAQDTEANLLASELRQVRLALVGNEISPALPESREFYWSKSQRQIEREASAPVRPARLSWAALLARISLPVAGVAAVAVAVILQGSHPKFPVYDDVSMTDGGMQAVTFHDQTAHMTVVWLQDNNDQNAKAAPTEQLLELQPDDGNSDASM